jgi:hypothetical protein
MAFMKLRLYAMAFLAFSFALSSCQKDDDPAPLPEVVGKWTLDYGVLSGFSNATINGAKVNPYSELYWGDYFLTSQIHILNNDRKSFVEVIKVEGFAEDLIGTWNYENKTLVMDYQEGNIPNATYTYRTTNDLDELISAPEDIRLDSTNVGKIQYVYRK